jgi:hypothetical protein
MRARARPAPILRACDEPRPHRVEADIAQRGCEIRLVHRGRAEASLPEMPRALVARLDDAGIGAMHARQRAAQAVGVGRDQDQMHVVRHQAPGPDVDVGRATMAGEQVAVERIVLVAEERPGSPVATLGDMVRETGDDDTSKAGHAASCRARGLLVN